MVVNNTVNRSEGCASDKIRICSVQSYVKDERGELNVAKYTPVIVGHEDEIVIKAGTHNVSIDKDGNKTRKSTTRKVNQELTH